MVLLEGDEFLSRLTLMFEKARPSGSVLMTIKRYDGRDKPVPRTGEVDLAGVKFKCLIRATHKSEKISTVVEGEDVPAFQEEYARLLRVNLDGLEKKSSKETKNKSKAAL